VWISPSPNGHIQVDYVVEDSILPQREINAPQLTAVIRALRARRNSGEPLLPTATPAPGTKPDARLRDLGGLETSAKVFRTWHATIPGRGRAGRFRGRSHLGDIPRKMVAQANC
jgi:hypothetical protein